MMPTKVSVLVPWTPGDEWRERAWEWVQMRYAQRRPFDEVITGSSPPGAYNRCAAIRDAASRATGDLFVVADADVWCDPTAALRSAARYGWAVPHRLIHRLSRASTAAVLGGANWRGLPLSDDNPQDTRPYPGNPTGTMVVIARSLYEQVPPDPRFIGWGQEDEAWGLALKVIAGRARREAEDLVHLWHPPQPRLTRAVGNEENRALLRRYRTAARSRTRMLDLLAEIRS